MDFALQKNRQSMGRRYIEVFRAKKTDYYAAVAAFVTDPPPAPFHGGDGAHGALDADAAAAAAAAGAGGALPRPALGGGGAPRPDPSAAAHTGVLKLRGLPFSATKDDIISFFDDAVLGGVAPLVHDSIHIVTSIDGRPSGVAFVEFGSADDAKAAMRKDRHSMGTRYVELFPSSRDEATRAATAAR
jgi:heterogeneous nuclear ribonucleoprotein F/H